MQTKKIFLASSSELKADRDEFEIFINRKNKDWVGKGIFLELVIWEDFLDAVSRTRLQDEYNQAIRACDLFVMLFQTKVGQYTEEEFETAFGQFKATGKPFIFTYFKDATISTGDADDDALMSLLTFKKKLKALGHFHTPYRNVDALKLHFTGQLDKLAANGHIQSITQVPPAGVAPEEAKSVIAHYLHALASDLAGLKLSEIDTAAGQPGQSPLELADIYVPLATTQLIPQNIPLAHWLARDANTARNEIDPQRETRPVSALEALAEHRELTLLGKPGSGKSTFGASVLLTLAQAGQGHNNRLAELGDEWQHGILLPIRVILRRFAEQLPPGDQAVHAGDLWAFIGKDLNAGGYGLSADTMECVRRIARDHGALILLDGLDECGDSIRRGRVLAAVREFMQHAGAKCRFVLTARPYAWADGADPARGVYTLADLNDAQIEHFIRAWYAAMAKRAWLTPGEAERKKEDLLKVRLRPDLLPLAQNPLLLTLMATLHTNRGRLPDDRADLYNDSVELLLLRWNRQIGADRALLDELEVPGLKLSDLREALEELAFKIHEQNAGRDGAADIGEDRLVRAFTPLLNSKDKADVVVEYIEKRAGLLIGQGEKDGERQFTFPHRTFQEFLAACHLAAKDDFAAECVRLARAAAAHWQVVLPLAARLAKAERGAGAADELIHGVSIAEYRTRHKPDAGDWECALLAGSQLLEIGLGAIHKGERTRAIAGRVIGWIAAGLPLHPLDGGAAALRRAQAGDVLAALGDPRFDPQRGHLPNDEKLGFVRIPADPDFCIGTRNADAQRVGARENEINDQPSPTPEFYLARYPVTVAQFREFVVATGSKLGDEAALLDPDNRPVARISWREALAYCAWLNDRLDQLPGNEITGLVRVGWRVALPSELEWEKAARGGRTTAYPWGDKADANRANYEDTGIGDTSAVGCFPANDYGLYDMSGNVWEWTRSLWGKDWKKPEFAYPYNLEDRQREDTDAGEDVLRVVRGGGWLGPPGVARCAYRNWDLPDNRYYDLGFRVVLRSSPV
ncbi:MAG: SUMF1/EgtB/PvdO family nonheme iron enzyme [Sulfuricellaceae bacterium]